MQQPILRHVIHFTLLALGLALAYGPVLIAAQTVNTDAHVILGNLSSNHNLAEYLSHLLSYQAVDMQPVRDLSLYFDLWAFRSYGLQTGILQNLCYWLITCWTFTKVAELVFSKLAEKIVMKLTGLLALYPLFGSALAWGMARKHILATMFIMLATWQFLLCLQQAPHRRRHAIFFTLAYWCSILAQPITLLWPIWAAAYAWLRGHRGKFYWTLSGLWPAFVVIGALNFQYYQHSAVYQQFYNLKLHGEINLSDMVLALGHYSYQLILPYWPTTSYNLGDESVLIGMGLLCVLGVTIWRTRQWKPLLPWLGFALFPLIMVLRTPQSLFDTYLLVPGIALWLGIAALCESHPRQSQQGLRWAFIPLLLIWGSVNYIDARLWLNPITFLNERNFVRRPSCESAMNLAIKSLTTTGSLPNNTKDFLENHDCTKPDMSVPKQAVGYIVFQSHLIYAAPTLTSEQKAQQLERLGQYQFYPQILQALVYYESNKPLLAQGLMKVLADESHLIKWEPYRDYLIATKLRPYCEREQDINCLRVTEHFMADKPAPYL